MRLLILLGALLLAACQTAAVPGPEPLGTIDRRGPPPLEGISVYELDDFLVCFELTTLSTEDFPDGSYPDGGSALTRWYWSTAVVGIDDGFDAKRLRAIRDVFREIETLTGVRIEYSDNTGRLVPGEIKVLNPTRKELAEITKRLMGQSYICFADLSPHPNSIKVYVSARAVLSQEKDIQWRECIYEEIGHAFAFGRDTNQFLGKTLYSNVYQEFDGFTPWDKLNLWVTYDPRLRPGMPAEEAMPIVRQIVAELREMME